MTRVFFYFLLLMILGNCTTYKTFYKETKTVTNSSTHAITYRLKIKGIDALRSIELASLQEIKYLELRELSVKDIDLLFAQLPQPEKLEVLLLDSLHLQRVPRTIKRFKNLNHLSLNYNPELDLDGLFKELEMLPIQFLNLQYNHLKGLPAAIAQIQTLQDLNLSNNNIQDKELYHSLAKLPELQSLWLTNNELTAIPEEIGQLSQLKSLYIEKNLLKEIPQEVSDMKKVAIVHAGHNHFKELPTAFANMPRLILLHINNCKIKFIPAIYETKKYALKGLILDQNELSDANKKFWKKKLRRFFLLSME